MYKNKIKYKDIKGTVCFRVAATSGYRENCRRMKETRKRRGTKMTPPPRSLWFVMLMATACFVLAAGQMTDFETSAGIVFTDTTTLEVCKYTTWKSSRVIQSDYK